MVALGVYTMRCGEPTAGTQHSQTCRARTLKATGGTPGGKYRLEQHEEELDRAMVDYPKTSQHQLLQHERCRNKAAKDENDLEEKDRLGTDIRALVTLTCKTHLHDTYHEPGELCLFPLMSLCLAQPKQREHKMILNNG